MAGRKLKVFQAQFGFYDTVVAAPSQPEALRAWGTHQNLFASGQARITEDPQAIEAALAHPQRPLKRAVGSNEPFALEATSLPVVPDAPRRTPASKTAKAPAGPTARPRPAADRSRLDAAEAALQALDARRKTEEAELQREATDLESRKMAAQAAYVAARKAATAKVVLARSAYRAAGGDG